ncbi:hypothetical protein AAF712_015904 [Marasmius tenuissimus]|uniref:Uncharacterized protein n=1 Tax=Marasmius tenuissimus TaxID=585030 RepID=A0ABR2Z895_9AGAR
MELDPEDGVESNSEDGSQFGSMEDRIPKPDSQDTLDPEECSTPPSDEGTMTRWVKRLGFLKNTYTSSSRDESNLSRAGGQGTERKEIDSDAWSLVDRED